MPCKALTHFQAFSTSAARRSDLAKLTLIGRLGKTPELRTTKSGREYISCDPQASDTPFSC